MFIKKLHDIAAKRTPSDLSELLANSDRFNHYKTVNSGITLDFSRQLVNDNDLAGLYKAASQSGFNNAYQQMQAGAEINTTEGRAVLHTLLRAPNDASENATEVAQSLDKMRQLAQSIKSGEWTGATGKRITDVVNIGIGGSDLGPRMVYRALKHFRSEIKVHWVANIDPADIENKVASLDAETTLFVVSSKSFSTPETLNNALAARRWLIAEGISNIAKHVVAASSNIKAATEFGIDADNIFPLWDWVGGRFSVWSAIGLPIMIGTQDGTFEAFLEGAHNMDMDAAQQPIESNLSAQLALLELWNQHANNTTSRAVLPYCHDLRLLPAHLQQLEMESLGKTVDLEGNPVDYTTGLVVWGTEGSNGQHSYHQLLHQGNQQFAAEIILPLSTKADPGQHAKLVANALAQSQAFCHGQSQNEAKETLSARGMADEQASFIAKHKEIKGNRAHSIISFKELTPHTLGALVAAYENKVFFCGFWLNINAFDQWGVELGKVHASAIEKAIEERDFSTLDGGYQRLLSEYLS